MSIKNYEGQGYVEPEEKQQEEVTLESLKRRIRELELRNITLETSNSILLGETKWLRGLVEDKLL